LKKNIKLLITAVITVIFALCFFIFQPENKSDKHKIHAKPQPIYTQNTEKLFNINYNDVKTVNYSSLENEVTLSQDNKKWIVNQNELSRIDYIKIDIILNELLNIESKETVSSTLDNIQQWGIDSNSSKIVISESDSTHIINIGSSNPSKTGHYIQIEGRNKIYLVRDTPNLYLNLNINDIRNRNLPVLNINKMKSLTISGKKEIHIVPYISSDKFTANVFTYMLTKPYNRNIPADSEKMSELLQSLKKPLQIVEFIDNGTPAEFGLKNSGIIFRYNDTDGKTFNLKIGNSKSNNTVYAKLEESDQIFTLNKKNLTFLSIDPLYLIDKFAHLVSLDSIDYINITEKKTEINAQILNKNNTITYIINNKAVNEKSFKKFYENIIYLLIEGEVEEDKLTSNTVLIISFKLKGSESEWTTINFYKYNEEFYAVSNDDEKPLFLVGKYQIEQMLNKVNKI